MRIAIDLKSIIGQKTGKEIYAFNIISYLIKNIEHEFILYAQTSSVDLKQFQLDNTKIITFDKTGFSWHFAVYQDLLKRVKQRQVDAYFSPSSYIIPALFQLFSKKLLKSTATFTSTTAAKANIHTPLKIFITIHDLVAFKFPKTHNKKAVLIERLTLSLAIKAATKIFCVSNNTKNDVRKQFKVDLDKMIITHNAVTIIDSVKTNFTLPKKFILSLGSIVPRKNLNFTLKAFEELCNDSRYKDIDLVIIGGKSWGSDELQMAKLNPRIHILGYVDVEYLPYIYSQALIFVYPSLYEGFGIPPLEAQAYGCPVITSDISSLPEVVGKSAIQINPTDLTAFIVAIQLLLNDKDKRAFFIKEGYKNVKRFSWENSSKIILNALNS